MSKQPGHSSVLMAHRAILSLSRHWLAGINLFFLLYTGLPLAAPWLMAGGYTGLANRIYAFYRISCHQMPARSFFMAGEQTALCQREIILYGTMLLGGLLFIPLRERLQPLPLRWYVFFLVPIAVDGGMQMASEWLQYTGVTMLHLWAIGLIALGVVSTILHYQEYLTWHSYLFFAFGPLALLYIQFFGYHESNLWLRIITATICGLGTVWYAYPRAERYFDAIRQQVEKSNRSGSVIARPEGAKQSPPGL